MLATEKRVLAIFTIRSTVNSVGLARNLAKLKNRTLAVQKCYSSKVIENSPRRASVLIISSSGLGPKTYGEICCRKAKNEKIVTE